MCEESAGPGVLSSMGELVGDKTMWAGGAIGLAAAVTVSWVAGNLLWLGLGVAVVALARFAWGVRHIYRTHQEAPQSSMWTPAQARTMPRGAIPAPARTELPTPRRALPAAKPALPQQTYQGLAELGGAILAVKTAQPVASERITP